MWRNSMGADGEVSGRIISVAIGLKQLVAPQCKQFEYLTRLNGYILGKALCNKGKELRF